MKNGFRSGHVGWCGGAIYFALSKGATYHKADAWRPTDLGLPRFAVVDFFKVREFVVASHVERLQKTSQQKQRD